MWLPLFGLFIGIIIGSLLGFTVPAVYAQYLSIAVLAALDSLLGGIKGALENTFDSTVLISGLIVNASMAALLAYIGDRMGLDLYMAAVFIFGFRLFANLSFIRRDVIARYRKKRGQKNLGGQHE